MAKKRHLLTLSSLMAIAILAVVSIGPATGQTNQLPTAEVAADATSGAVGDWFLFDGTASVDPDGTIATITWDFGDGSDLVKDKTLAEAGVIFHTFGADGTYTVTLTVTDDGGATNDPADPNSTIVITIGTGTATTTTTSTTTTTAPASTIDGAALFTTTCSICHTQADLAAKGLSNAQIVDVMTSGLMTAQASGLSSAEIQAVADYIIPAAGGTTTTTSPSATTTTTAAPAGASASSLFSATCSACHTKANITDRGLSSSQIVAAMTSGIMKAQASSLSSSQIQAVASYLAASGSSTGETTTTTAAPAGASASSLFSATCSACHTKANIADRGLSSSQIVAAMTSGIMTSQAGSLSSDQIQAVASYITSSGTSDETTDTAATDAGATATFIASPEAAGLYDANCAACHGTSGEGGVGPSLKDSAYNFDATVATISNGVGSMPGFSSGLTEDQIKDIAAYSVGFQGATATELPSGEGADVYAASCAACHGAKGEGASAMPINVPFDNDQLMEIIRVGIGDMPGFATTLSDTQITSLAEYVHALAAMSAPPVTEAPPSEDYIVAIQPSKYVEFDTERSSVPLEPTARLAFALGTLAVLAGLAYWEIQRARKGTGVAGSGGTSPSGSA